MIKLYDWLKLSAGIASERISRRMGEAVKSKSFLIENLQEKLLFCQKPSA